MSVWNLNLQRWFINHISQLLLSSSNKLSSQICKTLQNSTDIVHSSVSWLSIIKNCFNCMGQIETFNLWYNSPESFSCSQFIQTLIDIEHTNNTSAVRNSNLYPHNYSLSNALPLLCSDYLICNWPRYCSKLLAKLRVVHKCHFYFLSHKLISYPPEECTLCNLKVPNDFQHLFLECLMFRSARSRYLSWWDHSVHITNVFDTISLVNVKLIFFYLKEVLFHLDLLE